MNCPHFHSRLPMYTDSYVFNLHPPAMSFKPYIESTRVLSFLSRPLQNVGQYVAPQFGRANNAIWQVLREDVYFTSGPACTFVRKVGYSIRARIYNLPF